MSIRPPSLSWNRFQSQTNWEMISSKNVRVYIKFVRVLENTEGEYEVRTNKFVPSTNEFGLYTSKFGLSSGFQLPHLKKYMIFFQTNWCKRRTLGFMANSWRFRVMPVKSTTENSKGKSVPRVKMLLRAWKWAQPCWKQTPDHTFITFWKFPFKPLKNGLKNGKKKFLESNETLRGASTCSYDSIGMPSMTKNIDTEALITSQGWNTKTTTPTLDERVKN